MAVSVAVVTKRAGLALTLNSSSHRFREVRPVDGWEEEEWPDEVVVLDVGPHDATISAITRLRLLGCSRPLVAIVPTGDDARRLHEEDPEVRVTTLPVSPATLLEEIELALVAAKPVEVATQPPPAGGDSFSGHGEWIASSADRADPLTDAAVDADTSPRADESDVRSRGRREPASAELRLVETDELSILPAPRIRPSLSPATVANQLLSILEQALTVRAAAEVLLAEATIPVRADAAAVLVPDGHVFRVAAGSGLRPLEERLQIPVDHWIATEVAAHGRAILIEDTDIARSRLSGLPLARWTDLMAVPIPAIGGVLLLAREAMPFNRRDLQAVSRRVESSDSALADAIVVRRLARALGEFTDPVD